MSFPPTKRLKNMMINILSFLFTIFLLAGCAAQKTENTKTAEQDQVKSQTQQARTNVENERQISSVNVDMLDQGIMISIMGNQKLVYTSIKQSFPFGIAVYLPETKISSDFRNNVKENEFISNVVANYADKEMTTAKIEILLKKDLDYEVTEAADILKFVLSQPIGKDQLQEKSKPEPLLSLDGKKSSGTPAKDTAVKIPTQTATITNIEFNAMEDGKSNIVVETNHPVKYDITLGSKEKLYLNLYNTIIPNIHKRPLLTQYFKSAVESLMPVEIPGKQKNSKIEINIRDLVPYRVVQDQNTISLYFDPTTLEPPVFAKAKKTVSSNVQTETIDLKKKEPTPQGGKPPELAEKPKTLEEEMYGPKKKYSGEKIKLDFYETDIKNVFRILRSVGGLNFAIDKDVEGKVTLALEDPVPWDQVLDLVLKMNNLGQKEEGNVIRIATLDTIRKEEKFLQEAFTERKKSLDDKESLEPLVTEYIPINYSDAEIDIKPHIDQILTKGRGKISVDKRTNMIIVTDIQSKIDQVKETIYRLDKVTPQIMIEAKVVEVTKNFTRELGLGLGIGKPYTKLPTDKDFSIALNYPSSGPANTGAFNFYNVLGVDFLHLQAQISASETKGDVKVISSPRILTLDNKKAKIKQGLEFAYLERDSAGGSSVKFKNIDLLLEVTPHVTPDRRISMMVYLTKNDIDSITNGVPSLATNEAQTELLVNDNDTIVIGGIVKTTDNKSNSGTPLLSDIPVLGRLFRTDINKDNRNELLIFLTPSVIQLEQKRNNFTVTD